MVMYLLLKRRWDMSRVPRAIAHSRVGFRVSGPLDAPRLDLVSLYLWRSTVALVDFDFIKSLAAPVISIQNEAQSETVWWKLELILRSAVHDSLFFLRLCLRLAYNDVEVSRPSSPPEAENYFYFRLEAGKANLLFFLFFKLADKSNFVFEKRHAEGVLVSSGAGTWIKRPRLSENTRGQTTTQSRV